MQKDKTKKKVEEIIDTVRPYLKQDGGDVELLKVEKGIVYLKTQGACDGCPLVETTFYDGIERILLERVPGIIGVVLDEG